MTDTREDNSMFTPLLYYLIAPIPVAIIAYYASEYLLAIFLVQIVEKMGQWLGGSALFALGLETGGKINFFQRILPLIAIGAVIASILLIPKKHKQHIVGINKILCVIRANCVSLVTLCVVVIMGFLNPFGELLTLESLKGQGVPLTWTQIISGFGAFLFAHSVFMTMENEKQEEEKSKIRGTEKTIDEEDDFFMPEEN